MLNIIAIAICELIQLRPQWGLGLEDV